MECKESLYAFLNIRESDQQLKSVAFVSHRMLYRIGGRHWNDILVLDVHAPAEDISDDTRDSLNEELEHAMDQFPICT
jgi:hypothetical protein